MISDNPTKSESKYKKATFSSENPAIIERLNCHREQLDENLVEFKINSLKSYFHRKLEHWKLEEME